MIIKTAFVSFALLFSSQLLAEEVSEERFTFPLQSGGSINVENINGDVTVVGGSGQQVEVVVVKRAENAKKLAEIEIVVEAEDDRVSLETEYAKGGWFNRNSGNRGSVTYTLTVPANANIESVENVNGDVEVRGVSGNLQLETVNGDIAVDGASADAVLETVNGSIKAGFVTLAGDQSVESGSVNGSISLMLPADTDASVSAETVNGGIDGSDFGLVTNKGMVGRDLAGSIGNGSASLDVGTVNGAIKLSKGQN